MLAINKPKILTLHIKAQPDDVTCGPTCLHGVYQYYRDAIPLKQVIGEVKQLETGGTLAVQLGNHALARGYKAIIYTYNLHMFDPSWFTNKKINIYKKLEEQREKKKSDIKLVDATAMYLKFLDQGGQVRFEDLTPTLLKYFLARNIPILTGLSATYLYESPREIGVHRVSYNDISGHPTGHFVIINGYDQEKRQASIADPLESNPISKDRYYHVGFQKLINSIMLGVMTYDANLLIIYPK